MRNNSRNKPRRQPKRAYVHKPRTPGQADLDLELQLHEIVQKSDAGEGDPSNNIYPLSEDIENLLLPPYPPPPPNLSL